MKLKMQILLCVLILVSVTNAQDQRKDHARFIEEKNEFWDHIKEESKKFRERDQENDAYGFFRHKIARIP